MGTSGQKSRVVAAASASGASRVERSVLMIRRQRVILDADLAALYGVTTKAFNQAIKRNVDRFPADFMFRLSAAEKAEVVTNCDHLRRLRFSPQLPYAFTEHGAVMAASVLNSPAAIDASIQVVRAFVRIRQLLFSNASLRRKLARIERKLLVHDEQFSVVFDAIRQLMVEPEEPSKKRIGYQAESGE